MTSNNFGNIKQYRCFPPAINAVPEGDYPAWFIPWSTQFEMEKCILDDAQKNALSRLVPLLLCGEQSAQFVFGEEIVRIEQDDFKLCSADLITIQKDENAHEEALQMLVSFLPTPKDALKIKRKAQLFYTKIGQAASVVEHFATIRSLDGYVALIMTAMSRSNLGASHIISQLFSFIKHDESRHVSLARKHIILLGGDPSINKDNINVLRKNLVNLLKTEQASFEVLGVDSRKLFSQIDPQNT